MLAMTNVLAIANALANRTSTFNDLTKDDEVQLALSCTHRRDSLAAGSLPYHATCLLY